MKPRKLLSFISNVKDPHPILTPRLEAIHRTLIAGFDGSSNFSSATKGHERELFVSGLLRQVFPPTFRFGTGDVTDFRGEQSGQVDVVIEFPHIYSLPLTPDGPRLYMSETVAAVIEVKSNLSKQWNEALETAKKLKNLKRRFYHHSLQQQLERWEAKTATSDDPASRQMAAITRAELPRFRRRYRRRFRFSS